MSAAKLDVPVSAAQPECLLRISSAWAQSVSLVSFSGRRGREGGRRCFADTGVALCDVAGVRSVVEYERRVDGATAGGARESFEWGQAHAAGVSALCGPQGGIGRLRCVYRFTVVDSTCRCATAEMQSDDVGLFYRLPGYYLFLLVTADLI